MINPYWELVILLVLINIIFAQSLNIILGYNGQFALGQAGFLAIGAYTSAILVAHLHLPLFLAVIAACILTAFFGLIIGYPCLRLRGDYLAIATLGFAEIIRIVLLSLPADIFGGPTGIKNAPNIKEFFPDLSALNPVMNLVFTAAFALVTVLLAVWGAYAFSGLVARNVAQIAKLPKAKILLRYIVLGALLIAALAFSPRIGNAFLGIFQFQNAFSPESAKSTQWAVFFLFALVVIGVLVILKNYLASAFGRAVIAIREDEIAASNLGINVARVKLANFVFGCMFAGLAGALLAHTIPLFKPLDFNFFKSIDVLLMVVLGGMGTLGGVTLGAGIITVLPEALRFVGQWRLVIYALMLILLMIFRPTGILGSSEAARQVLAKVNRAVAPKQEASDA
jgi:ABC-type branched-subunit amino acid transport system permease subunit